MRKVRAGVRIFNPTLSQCAGFAGAITVRSYWVYVESDAPTAYASFRAAFRSVGNGPRCRDRDVRRVDGPVCSGRGTLRNGLADVADRDRWPGGDRRRIDRHGFGRIPGGAHGSRPLPFG